MPRPKSFLRLFFRSYGWGAAIAALVLAVSLTVTIDASRTAHRLQAEGATQTATLTGVTLDPRRPGSRPRGDRYVVYYSFNVGPTLHSGRQTVTHSFFRDHAVGDRVPVRYWTVDPTLSEVEPEAAFVSQAGIVICLVAGLAAMGLGRHAWRNAVEAAWMARNGQRHPAWILDHVQTSPLLFGSPLWRATWRAPDGTIGASARTAKSRLPAIGRKVTILVDPANRRPSRLECDICHRPRPPH